MNKPEFQTYTVIDEQIEVDNKKRFGLWLLCSTAVSFLVKTEDDAETVKQGGVPELIGYAEYAFGNITTLANTEAVDAKQPILRPIVQEVKSAIYAGEDAMRREPAKRKIGDFDKEFWWFYAEAIASFVDSFKITTNEHKTKKKDGEETHSHKTRIVIKHGDDTWAISVSIKNGVEHIKSFHNGHENRRTGVNSEPYVNEEAERVDFVLQKIAQSIAIDKAFDYLTIAAGKDAVAVKRAMYIANVLEGDYRYYILTAKHFKAACEAIVYETVLTLDEAISHFIDTKLRVDAVEKKVITHLFKEWFEEKSMVGQG